MTRSLAAVLVIGVLLSACDDFRLGQSNWGPVKPNSPSAASDEVIFVNKSGLMLYIFHIRTNSGGTALCDNLNYAGPFLPGSTRELCASPFGPNRVVSFSGERHR